jgi:cytidyltransferase-like protein
MPRQNHIYSLETLFKMTSDLKKRGKKVAFTHGAFDLFHIGHLDLLNRSSHIADFLIVGVENNANVSRYKTNQKPIIDENDRVEVINALNCVDATFINPYQVSIETYVYLYKNLFADYITIGPNFASPQYVHIQAHHSGSEVLTLGYERLASTSGIIDSIIKHAGIPNPPS